MGLTGTDPALMYGLVGVARLGATRVGYHSAEAFLTIGGVHVGVGKAVATYDVDYESLTIEDVLNEQPNTCAFSITGLTPTVGQEVILALGSKSNGRRLFAGHILTVAQRQVAAVSTVHYDASAVDYTWQLGFLKVTAFYAEQSATAIAQSLIASYAAANGFTAVNVQVGLPTVPGGITFTDEDLPNALTRLAARIGGYWYVDYRKDLHLFLTDTAQAPTDLTVAHPTLTAFGADVDLGQHINRVYVEGRGTKLLVPVAVGETILAVETVDMFTVTPNVFLKASFQGSDGGAQHLTYAGVVPGGAGSIVGPGVSPSSAPVIANAGGGSLSEGVYQYAYTDVTAAGETVPSPLGTLTTTTMADPTVAPTLAHYDDGGGYGAFGGAKPGDVLSVSYVYSADLTTAYLTNRSPQASLTFVQKAGSPTNYMRNMSLIIPGSTDPSRPYVQVYLTRTGPGLSVAGDGVWRRALTFTARPTAYYIYGVFNYLIWGANQPGAAADPLTAANPVLHAGAVSGISVGASPTTSRKVYRTVVNGSQLKLLTTIANNTATTYADSTADGSLGANAPTSDTSGLTQVEGVVNPGSTSLIVAGTGFAGSGGGWAIIGNGDQVIRYTGFSGGALIGIPATGVGSITAGVAYNSTVTAAPMLTGIPGSGVGSVLTALSAGDEIYLVVQRDTLGAQAQLLGRLGGDGIREEWIQDRRLSIAEAQARGDAFLTSRPLDAERVSYTCKDLNTTSGPTITVNLVAPTSVAGVFRIQRVTISHFTPALRPIYTVEASAQRWSFEDLLRKARA